MHVDSIKACTVESCRHFNMRVHALLTQYGNFRTCASGNIRCCHIFVDIERQFYIQARIGVVRFRLMLLIGTLRVVTQALHLPGSSAHQTRNVVRLSLNTVCPLAVITKRSPETACPT